MAVVMAMRWQGISPADYDQAREVVGWERDPAEGGLDHVAWFDTDGALRVIDVWESAEAFDRFSNERLMPGLAGAGLLEGKGEPEVTISELHAHWAPDRLSATS